MLEKIYTIPLNEAFESSRDYPERGCPFCALYNKLENDELEIILGASMMEPDIRIKTNKQGFCHTHYSMMFERKNRLGLALMLESHLNEVRAEMEKTGLSAKLKAPGTDAMEKMNELENSCYVCGRVDTTMGHMYENAVMLWNTEKEFENKIKAQPFFCLTHFKKFVEAGKSNLNKKEFAEFYSLISAVVYKYFDELRGDVSWFCKKFDYRYDKEPWGNARDAVERAIYFMSGNMHTDGTEKKE